MHARGARIVGLQHTILAIEKQAEGADVFQRQILDTLTTIREDIATLKERSRETVTTK